MYSYYICDKTMLFTNGTHANYFIILGLLNTTEMNMPLFIVFLCIFLVTLMGNIIIITVVCLDRALQNPMYFFLTNLSFLEIWYTVTIVPKLLVNLLVKCIYISFVGCMTQLFFFVTFGACECYLLLVMAYDRYLAICKPLYYSTLMNTKTCLYLLASGSWVGGFLSPVLPVTLISKLVFCGPNSINYFYCDAQPLLRLSCSRTYLTEATITILASGLIFSSFLLTVISYIFIILTILRIPTSSGRKKTFSTCASHLIVVIMYYGTITCIYMQPMSSFPLEINKVLSLLYTVVTPMLNPIIYSLRNKEIKKALWRTLQRVKCHTS
uniref:Olfactory receptor n=1 Tax=Xenopus tropicalis TaxID=8364 RepID=A0A6I8RNJ3_XENTR